MIINHEYQLHNDEHMDIYWLFYVDPVHHLHINKIARGAHLHVTPNPKYSRAITRWIDTHREMHVITVQIEACIEPRYMGLLQVEFSRT